MNGIDFFDRAAVVGDELLSALGGRNDAAPFLLRTRDVYRLLVDIHDDIVNAMVEVGEAQTLDEGRRVMRSLHSSSLEAVFRARRWCDEMETLGHDLERLPQGVQIADAGTWQDFTRTLQQREGEVARMYEEALYNVISRAESLNSLGELQNYINWITDSLVVQKAKFDVLAKRAAAIARRR